MKTIICLVVFLCIFTAGFAQDVQVNQNNKTIAVTADEAVTADPDVAVVKIGYHNFGTTKDGAFRENVRVAKQVTDALLEAEVPTASIETKNLSLDRVEPVQEWTVEQKKERQFVARQNWTVRVAAANAQTLVDLAVRAGANEVEEPDWDVSDMAALQAQAGAAALAKARGIAEQMAKGLGAKLGPLVYASNRAPAAKLWRGMTLNTSMASVSKTRTGEPELKLFPQKVRSEATVHAIFAIESP